MFDVIVFGLSWFPINPYVFGVLRLSLESLRNPRQLEWDRGLVAWSGDV